VESKGGEKMREWLEKARISKGYTMKQMGEKLDISESYYSMIESGDRQKRMDLTLVSKLSNVLEIPISVIAAYENEN
jgi:transcriptional regulator with XRE-family HTH domain